MLAAQRFAHISKEKRKKGKKEKRKPLIQVGMDRAVKVFWKNTTRQLAGGDFFKNPEGLTLTVLIWVGLAGAA
ncbi:hypothetical protein QWY31_00050 [Cytophagales bacterium LB-30]|uniref:Uncharacterized protein n=1 Tax=Shiella aurantiaca TaxID=3058365 RepID=A0ABT8F0D1_9BACT|nr:hypothetical protein [Shiella aurantiaca]MDN4163865.1 hypothetical protein [Shiella aurantiaca]